MWWGVVGERRAEPGQRLAVWADCWRSGPEVAGGEQIWFSYYYLGVFTVTGTSPTTTGGPVEPAPAPVPAAPVPAAPTLRPTSSRAAAYVNLTRGKHSNVTVITAADRDDIDMLPAAGDTTLVDQVVSSLTAAPNRPALAIDPDALIAHHLGTTRTLSDLTQAAEDLNGDVYERRLAQRAITAKLADIARAARSM